MLYEKKCKKCGTGKPPKKSLYCSRCQKQLKAQMRADGYFAKDDEGFNPMWNKTSYDVQSRERTKMWHNFYRARAGCERQFPLR